MTACKFPLFSFVFWRLVLVDEGSEDYYEIPAKRMPTT